MAGFFTLVFFTLVIGGGAVLVFVVKQYNLVQGMLQTVLASRANVAASMMKRLDLITKLQEVVTGYADHAMLTTTILAPSTTAASLSGNLNYVTSIATQLPNLRTNESYQHLMYQLGLVENDLQSKREIYNRVVRDYNATIGQLPLTLFAANIGFKAAPFVSPEDADSIEKLQEFTSNDGEAVRQMLGVMVAKAVVNTKHLTETVTTAGKGIIRDRVIPANAVSVPIEPAHEPIPQPAAPAPSAVGDGMTSAPAETVVQDAGIW